MRSGSVASADTTPSLSHGGSAESASRSTARTEGRSLAHAITGPSPHAAST